jgi:molecular chaperone HtpG
VATKETFGFQAEANQVLKLMIHSVYSNKEIFLRELVSNASDACDKLRFEALTDGALFEDDQELAIRIGFDAEARTVTVSDNGIGMSRQEAIDQIGTIAKSGTQEFLQRLTGDQAKDAQLIGQFGVGFYSAFVVAERVTVVTRRAGLTPEHGVRWESTGEGEYSVETVSKPERGTDVILHLREGEDELLSGTRLRQLLRTYSDHIALPVRMKKEGSDGDSAEDETVNQASALWARPKSDITAEQYEEFYKHVAHDIEAPLTHIHVKVEGRQEYTLLLFIPTRAPFDLWDRDHRHGIKLYVRRVFIMDDADQLMPAYLRFVRGVVDSNDLPLNISREILQNSTDVQAIRVASVKRVLGVLEDLAETQKDKYAAFWREFGRVLKEGVGEDVTNRDRLSKLLRFSSTETRETDDEQVSLADYVGRMQAGQDKIFYITAESLAAARNSPHLEIFRKKGIEVLLLHDRVDEWVVSHLAEFDGKPLTSVAQGDLDLGTLADVTDSGPAAEGDLKSLAERMQKVLESQTQQVRVTTRLTDSPACLVSDHAMSRNLERMLKEAGQSVPAAQPVMEINPGHPIVERLKDETDDERFSEWTQILFDQALLAEGGQLDDPAGFVKRMNALLLALSGTRSRIWTPGS